MALGGVLRAALRAGDWARAAAQSRRQARALRSFSPEFGQRSSRMQPGEWLRSRGVDSPDDVYRFSELPEEFGGGFGARSVTPDGRVLFRSMEGPEQRITYNPDMLRPGYSPIVAPYEGFRALRPFDSGRTFGAGVAPAGPFMGRGRPSRWGILRDNWDSGRPFDDFDYGYQPMNLDFPYSELGASRPMWPWESLGMPLPMRPSGYRPPFDPGLDVPF